MRKFFRPTVSRIASAAPAALLGAEGSAGRLAARLGWMNFQMFHCHACAARRDLPRRLQTFNRAFAERHEQADLEFVALARALRGLYETAQSLAKLVSGRLEALGRALEASRISGNDGLAADSIKTLHDGLKEAFEELSALRLVAEDLRRLNTQVQNIERVGMFVRTSVFGFAVESSRTPDCQHTFGTFVAELRALGDKITGMAEAIGDQVASTRATQAREAQTLGGSHARLCELAKELEATAGVTAAQAQALCDSVLGSLQQAGERMRQITHHAQEAVFYLQFGDIVRQKTEHIAAALNDVAERLSSAASWQDFRDHAAAVDRVFAIQIGQLDLIRKEVTAAQQKLEESFRSIAEETSQLRQGLHHGHEETDSSRAGAAPLAAFKAELRRLEQLHGQGHELRLGTQRTVQNMVEASRKLAGHVEQVKTINADIHLQALNAIVKTAALGSQGSTLSVLSMHVDWLYRESHEVVKEIGGILESVLSQAHARAGGHEPTGEAAGENRLHAGMEEIESAYKACRETSAAASELIERQQTALDGGRARLQSLARHAEALGEQIGELNGFREMLAPWLNLKQAGTAPGIESLSQRYTMHSEREIHEGVGPNLAAQADPTAGAAALFQQPEEKPDRLNPDPLSTAATRKPAAAELGDNVELF